MGILQGCRKNDWPLERYHSAQHPYHASLLSTLSGFSVHATSWVTDGCLLPTPILSLQDIAKIFSELASSSEPTSRSVRELMMKNPEWIGGPHCSDTKLMQANPGALIAKEGADGLYAVAILPTPKYPKGLGIIVKIYAGFLPAHYSLALSPILERFELKSIGYVPRGQEVRYFYSLAP